MCSRNPHFLALCVLLLLAPAAARGEGGEPPANDELGFPIVFNEEIITRSDVLRGLPSPETLGSPLEVKRQRDRVLMEHLTEMVGRIYDIQIEERDIKDELERRMTRAGGEAKFYEYLSQAGQTLEGFRHHIRLQILDAHLNYMFVHGYTPGRRLLPWNPVPTPAEIAIACKNDPARRDARVRLRVSEMILDVDKPTRARIAMQQLKEGRSKEWVQEQMAAELADRVAAVTADLAAGVAFAQATEKHGRGPEGENPRWLPLPQGEPRDEVDRFLKGAKAGDSSAPIPSMGGGLRILHVEETENPGDLASDDPAVLSACREKIQDLRRRKAEALLRIRALDESTLRPERVYTEFRGVLLAGLREADEGLQALGLH